MFSYSRGLNFCCSSYEDSWYSVLPWPPPCTGIVQSTNHTHPLAQFHWCRTHTAGSPGSFGAPECGNHGGKSHSDGPPHVPKIKKKERHITHKKWMQNKSRLNYNKIKINILFYRTRCCGEKSLVLQKNKIKSVHLCSV